MTDILAQSVQRPRYVHRCSSTFRDSIDPSPKCSYVRAGSGYEGVARKHKSESTWSIRTCGRHQPPSRRSLRDWSKHRPDDGLDICAQGWVCVWRVALRRMSQGWRPKLVRASWRRVSPRLAPKCSALHLSWHLLGGGVWQCFDIYVPPAAGESHAHVVARAGLGVGTHVAVVWLVIAALVGGTTRRGGSSHTLRCLALRDEGWASLRNAGRPRQTRLTSGLGSAFHLMSATCASSMASPR